MLYFVSRYILKSTAHCRTTSDMMKQSLTLARKPHVVIATPGRLADHLKSTDTVSLKKIRFLVSGPSNVQDKSRNNR